MSAIPNKTIVTIFDKDSIIFSNSYSFDDLKAKIKLWDVVPNSPSLIRACFIPVRTSLPIDFSKNLFFPTLFYRALRIDSLALKTLAFPAALALDLITLIPRLITSLFKTDAEIVPPLLSVIPNGSFDYVRVHITYSNTAIEGDRSTKLIVDESREIALKPFSRYNNTIRCNNKELSYQLVDGEWDLQSNYDLPPKFFSYS